MFSPVSRLPSREEESLAVDHHAHAYSLFARPRVVLDWPVSTVFIVAAELLRCLSPAGRCESFFLLCFAFLVRHYCPIFRLFLFFFKNRKMNPLPKLPSFVWSSFQYIQSWLGALSFQPSWRNSSQNLEACHDPDWFLSPLRPRISLSVSRGNLSGVGFQVFWSACLPLSDFTPSGGVHRFPGGSRRWRIHLPMRETRVWSLGREDPLEKGVATHSSILSWRIPWTEEPWRATARGVAKSRTRQRDWHFFHSLVFPWERALGGVFVVWSLAVHTSRSLDLCWLLSPRFKGHASRQTELWLRFTPSTQPAAFACGANASWVALERDAEAVAEHPFLRVLRASLSSRICHLRSDSPATVTFGLTTAASLFFPSCLLQSVPVQQKVRSWTL